MQAVASAFSSSPTLTLAIGVFAGALLVLVIQTARDKKSKRANPLQGMFQSEAFNDNIDAIADRRTFAHRSGAVLRARVDHLPQVKHLWGHGTRDAALAQRIRYELKIAACITQTWQSTCQCGFEVF